MSSKRRRMATFSLRGAPDDAPRSPDGVRAASQYEGPHGPAYAGYGEGHLTTCVWGSHVPEASLDYGPYGRLDGERYGLRRPVPIRVDEVVGEVVQPDWALFRRRGRGVHVSLGPRFWLYRVAGLTRASRLERRDGTEVATEAGAFGTSRIALDADTVDVAVAVLVFSGVSVWELTVQT